MLIGSAGWCGQNPGGNPSSAIERPIDVVVLVLPSSPDTARVIVNYRKVIPHDRVKKEIAGLEGKGWQVAKDLRIEDRSINPNDLEHHPKTTGATFTLLSAPQVQDDAPALSNYLTAFQSWEHLEVMFELPGLPANSGVDTFNSAGLSVKRIPDATLFHYDISIFDHAHPLPALHRMTSNSGSLPSGRSEETPQTRSSHVPLLPVMLLIVGVSLIAGAGIYLFLARKSSDRRSSRSIR